jgi:hypothetical protein
VISTRGASATSGAKARVATAVSMLVLTASALLAGPVHAAESPAPSPAAEGDEAAGAEEAATPLTVELTSLSPGVVPRNGPVVLEGTVRNDSDEVWVDVNAAVFLGEDALTTREEVARAAATPETTAVGGRLDLPGSFVQLGDLEPGAEAAYSVQVPAQALPSQEAPGVYWIGIHALGTNADGRDSVADGRARTLIPVVSQEARRAEQVPVSLLLPLREPALRAGDGSLAEPGRWVRRTSARLGRLADFAASSGSRSLTWLLDPAVLDALDDLGQGNPPLSLGGAERDDATSGASEGPSDGPAAEPGPTSSSPDPAGPSPSESPGDAEPEIDEDGLPDPGEAAAARELLDRLVQQVASEELLALPYADVDAVALARERPELLVRAMGATQQSLAARGLTGRPAIAPPDGLVDLPVVSEVLPRLPEGTGVVMSDQGELDLPATARLQLPDDGQVSESEGVREANPLVLTDARASAGGPSPVAATDPLALRQRVLAEASVEVEDAAADGLAPRPVVVTLPDSFDPGPDWSETDFFPELDTPWLDLTGVPTGSSFVEPGEQRVAPDEAPEEAREGAGEEAREDPPDDAAEPALPAYPREAREAELPRRNALAAEQLVEQAEALDGLLANVNDVLARLTGGALQATSYAARERPRVSAGSARALGQTAEDALDDVAVFGTEFVTLSGGSGTLTITLVNDLAQPVTLGVEVRSREDVRAESPDPVELGPEQRATLRLPIVSEEGVHDVDLQPVTSAGNAVGEPFGFVLRTSQVGRLVWFVMAGGLVVFAVTLLQRVRQRLRERREREQATPTEVTAS